MTIINEFNSLGFSDKVIVIALYLIGMVIVILYAKLITKRQNTKTLHRGIPSPFPEQKIEESINTTRRYYKNESLQKPHEKTVVWQHLLGKILNIAKKVCLYCSTNDKRNNQKQNLHARGIVTDNSDSGQSQQRRTHRAMQYQ